MLRRSQKKLHVLDKYLIVCEGQVTEPTYFDAIRQDKRLSDRLVVIERGAGVPLSVVQRAVALKRANQIESGKDTWEVFKEVWAVFDRDEHPAIAEAKALSAQEGIKIAFSNPCFELFLLLHFSDYTKNEHRDVVSRKLRQHIEGYNKAFDYEELELMRRYPEAKSRCRALNLKSVLRDNIPSAPYCSIPPLVDLLLSLPDSPYKR